MKKFSLILFSLFLLACNTIEKKQETPTDPTIKFEKEITNKDIQSEKIETVEMGMPCGGITKIACKSGLKCKLNPNSNDHSGICEDTVFDKTITCPKDQKPVCGIRNNNKNGYLNECEAKRHGAEVLHEGFCKLDTTVKNSCTGKILGLEGCNKNIQGFEFDGKNCISKTVQGCQAEIPFENKELCEQTCLKKITNPTKSNKMLKACPEEKIVNQMPTIKESSITPKTYFIYQGKRHEINDFDSQYLEENCTIKETIVS